MAGLHINGDTYIGTTGIKIKDCIKESLPVGTIIEYPANSNLPTGFMICDGSAISRTIYADLFAIIGTSFGSGDGSTTFNLPNKQGKVTVGYQSNDTSFNAIGKTGGEKSHQLTVDEMPAHKHSSSYNTAYDTGTTGWGARIVTSDTYTFGITNMANIMQNTGGNGYHNNLQPYIVSNFIIKVSKTSVMTSGSVVDNLNGSSTTDAPSVRAVKDALVYESGSNSNGYYLKFGNGIMLCCGRTTSKDCAANTSTNFDVTLPAAFANNNYSISLSRRSGGNNYISAEERTTNVGTSGFIVYAWNGSGATAAALQYDYVAMGVWR